MKKIYLILGVVLSCNIVVAQKQGAKVTPAQKETPNATPALKQESKETSVQMDAATSSEDNMKPGPMHQMLARFNGEWKEEVTFWTKPGGYPMTSSSSCTNQMIMDRYQESIHVGDMNGIPFEGRGYLGYDNAKKVFVSSWMDNMGTGIMQMEGTWDEKSKTIHFIGKSIDAKTGNSIGVREELKFIDDNNQLMEMYITNAPIKEYKVMAIKFKR